MRSEMSEFSYGFAVTHELVTRLGSRLKAAPVLPSLLVEGRAGGGYDLMIDTGVPLLMQFKLTERMIHPAAREYATFSSEYFRLVIRGRKRGQRGQHRELRRHERAGRLVRYVAPAFHKATELDDRFKNGTVVACSALLAPADIGNFKDRLPHVVAFDPKGTKFYRWSNRTEIERAAMGERALENLIDDFGRARAMRITPRFFRELSAQFLGQRGTESQSEDFWSEWRSLHGRSSPATQAATLARVVLGSELVILRDGR